MSDIWQIINFFCFERGTEREESELRYDISSALTLYVPSGFCKMQPFVMFCLLLSRLNCPTIFSVSSQGSWSFLWKTTKLPFFLPFLSSLENTQTKLNTGVHHSFIKQQDYALCPASWPSAVFFLPFGCDSDFRYGSMLPNILTK